MCELKMVCWNGMVVPITTGTLAECRSEAKDYMKRHKKYCDWIDRLSPNEWEMGTDGLIGDFHGNLVIRGLRTDSGGRRLATSD